MNSKERRQQKELERFSQLEALLPDEWLRRKQYNRLNIEETLDFKLSEKMENYEEGGDVVVEIQTSYYKIKYFSIRIRLKSDVKDLDYLDIEIRDIESLPFAVKDLVSDRDKTISDYLIPIIKNNNLSAEQSILKKKVYRLSSELESAKLDLLKSIFRNNLIIGGYYIQAEEEVSPVIDYSINNEEYNVSNYVTRILITLMIAESKRLNIDYNIELEDLYDTGIYTISPDIYQNFEIRVMDNYYTFTDDVDCALEMFSNFNKKGQL